MLLLFRLACQILSGIPLSMSYFTSSPTKEVPQDSRRRLTTAYDVYAMPQSMTLPSGTITTRYDAMGVKLAQTMTPSSGPSQTTEYYGGVEVRNDELYAVSNPDGRTVFDIETSSTEGDVPWHYEYALKDHLGSTRVLLRDRYFDSRDIKHSVSPIGSVDQGSPFVNILQVNDYYPLRPTGVKGPRLRANFDHQAAVQSEDYQFEYTGKERISELELDWQDYGARWYDAALGRWGVVDPLADQAPNLTPYRYGFNNPISFTDPSGMFESSNHLYNELRNQQSLGVASEKEAAREQNDPATLDVDFVNYNDSNASTSDIVAGAMEAKRILGRNGIAGKRLSFHFYSEAEVLSLPPFYSYRDRHLFLGITNNRFPSIGVSDIKHNLTVGTHIDGSLLSGIDYNDVNLLFGDTRGFGRVIAHELAHQLDAFSRASVGDSGYPRERNGHYYNQVNLLMRGQGYSHSVMKRGGQHELLPHDVQVRILKYFRN